MKYFFAITWTVVLVGIAMTAVEWCFFWRAL